MLTKSYLSNRKNWYLGFIKRVSNYGADLLNAGAGMYTVQVNDVVSGCCSLTTVIVGSSNSLQVATQVQNASCGATSGSAIGTASGGSGIYSYQWSNGAGIVVSTTSTLSNAASGSYTLVVSDAAGCSQTKVVTINNTAGPQVSGTVTNVLCNGSASGSIVLTVSSGTSPVSYLWSNGSTSKDLTGVTAGVYRVTAKDANGCQSVQSFTITQPSEIVVTLQPSPASCTNLSDGSVSLVSVSGGGGAYSYSWSPSVSTATSLTGLRAGTYTLTVTDANGCQAIAIANVVSSTCHSACQPPVLTMSAPICNTAGTGYSVQVTSSLNSSLSALNGVISGNRVTAINASLPIVVTAISQVGCSSSLTVVAPANCPTPVSCTAVPELTVGQPVCQGNGQYLVSFMSRNGQVMVQGGTINSNTIVGSVGTSMIVSIAGSSSACGSYSVVVGSPAACPPAGCTNPLVSVSGPQCSVSGFYTVAYAAQPGVTVTVSAGVPSDGLITGVPVGSSVSVTAHNGSCLDQVITIAAPTNCMVCQVPVLTVTGPVCDPTKGLSSINYIMSNGATITTSDGTIDAGAHTVYLPANKVVVITATNTCGVTSRTVVTGITCTTCAAAINLSTGNAVCVDGNSYVASVTASAGTTITAIGGSFIGGLGVVTAPIGTNVTVVASAAGCTSQTQVIGSPAQCPGPIAPCISGNPLVSVSGPLCDKDGLTYSLRFMAPTGVLVTVSSGTVSSSVGTGMVNGIPLGSTLTLTAVSASCSVTQVVMVSAPVCSAPVAPCFNAFVYLQGALVDPDGVWPTSPVTSTVTAGEPLMRDDLRAQGLLPLTDPYRTTPYVTTFYPGGAGSVAALDPFAETITNPAVTLADRGDRSVVDWVLVEFRDKTNPSVVKYTRSGLVLRNGAIVDMDGQSCLDISHVTAGDYFVAVRHRNHLGAMTQTTRSLNVSGSTVTVDFRKLAPTDIWHDTANPLMTNLYGDKERRTMTWAPGYYALWGGNANRDQSTIYQGQLNDPQEVFNQITSAPGNVFNNPSYILKGYYSGDVNMDGTTIFQGQRNDTHVIYNIMTQHPSNILNNPSFIIVQQIP